MSDAARSSELDGSRRHKSGLSPSLVFRIREGLTDSIPPSTDTSVTHKFGINCVIVAALIGLPACTSTEGLGVFNSEPQPTAATEDVAAVRRGPPPAPASLIDKDKQHLLSALGTPTLLREELQAQMWQYSGQSCAFFLYLYPDTAGVFRVTHLEARANQGGSIDPQACLEAQFGKKVKS